MKTPLRGRDRVAASPPSLELGEQPAMSFAILFDEVVRRRADKAALIDRGHCWSCVAFDILA